MKKPISVALGALALCACAGNPQALPVAVAHCRAVPAAQGFSVVANIENTGTKPLSSMTMAMSFYSDFRYRKFTGSSALAKELDPGEKRDLSFVVSDAGATRMNGPAMGCFVTRVRYLDGTAQDAPPPQ